MFNCIKELCENNGIFYKLNEPMSLHTSFKIGGPADIFVVPQNKAELLVVLNKIRENKIPYFIIGKGSNLLVSDKGIEGVVISLSSINEIKVEGEKIYVQAGATLSAVCKEALRNSLSGMEFSFGIPGGIGGALYMNAGAYGGEMSQIVESAEYIDIDGNIKEIALKDMELGYRTSIFKKCDKIITSVVLNLQKGKPDQIKSKMDDFLDQRKTKQPLEYPSAGSTFKRPQGYFAGTLIEQNGLKGLSIGGAKVSEKHAGFVINYNNATCKDVKSLIKKIQDIVYKSEGVKLETEVIFVGK